MVAELYKDLSDSKVIRLCENGKTIAENFPEITYWKKYAVIVNGKYDDSSHVCRPTDKIIVRQIPFAVETVVTWVFIIVSFAVAIYSGVQNYKTQKAYKKVEEELEKLKNATKDDITNLPYLRGATNTVATGKTQPYMIGKNLYTPLILNAGKNYKGYSTISGTDGKTQFYNVVLECGFSKQNIKKIYADDITLKNFDSNECQEGKFSFETNSVFASADSFLEIAQDGNPFETDGFNQKVIEKQYNELFSQKTAENPDYYKDKFYTLENNSMGADVCIMFNGLRKYNDDGSNTSKERNIVPSYSVDYAHLVAIGDSNPEEHATWIDFTFNQNGTNSNRFVKNIVQQIRYNAHVDFGFNEIFNANGTRKYNEPVTIRISSPDTKPSGSNEISDCYINWIHSYCYDIKKSTSSFVADKIINEKEAKLSTLLGIRIESTSANEDKLKSIQIITSGVARTWNSSSHTWSTNKTPTSNPASWLLEVLTSDCHLPSKIEDDEIDLQALGAWYEFCETKGFSVNHVISAGMVKSSLFDMICDCGRGYMYRNIYGKVAIAIDGVKENAIAVLNEQNLVSFSYTKNLQRKSDGVRLTYIDKDMDYQENSIVLMYDGSDPEERSADSVITALNVQGKTNHEEVCRQAYYLMKKEKLRPNICKAEMGNEGMFFTPLSKVLVQHPALKIGKGNGEIRSLILNEAETEITGLELYDSVDLSENRTYSMIVQCVGTFGENEDYCTPLLLTVEGNHGRTKEVTFTTPLSVSTRVIPHAKDVFSYGFSSVNIFDEMVIAGIEAKDNGFVLTLTDYDERIVNDSETIPAYVPDYSAPLKPFKNPDGLLAQDVQNNLDTAATKINQKIDEIEEAGVSTVTYLMELNTPVMKQNGAIYSPSSIVAEGVKKMGEAEHSPWFGCFKIYRNDGVNPVYESGTGESSITYNIPANTEKLKVEFWNTDKTTILDRQTIPTVKEGNDAYTIYLKDTFQSFKADTDGNLPAQIEFITDVVGYRGVDLTDVVIDESEMARLNGTVPGLTYSCPDSGKLKLVFASGSALADSGRILVPVLVESEFDSFVYGYADENGIAYGQFEKHADSKYIILFFDYQKIKVKDVTRDNIIEYSPKYLGKVSDVSGVTVSGNGDWFLYSGTESASHIFKTGCFYVYYNGQWSLKDDTEQKEMDDIFNDMLSLVDAANASAPVVSIVNRLVTSEAFIDKLATRIISLQSGGLIKSSNFDGRITVDEAGNHKLDFDSEATDGFAIDTFGNARLFGKTEIGEDAIIHGKITTENLIILPIKRGTSWFNNLIISTPGRTQGGITTRNKLYIPIEGEYLLNLKMTSGTGVLKVDRFDLDTRHYSTVYSCEFEGEIERPWDMTFKAGDIVYITYSSGSATRSYFSVDFFSNVKYGSLIWSLLAEPPKEVTYTPT